MTRHSVARAAHQNMNLWGKSFKRSGFEYETKRAHRVQGYLRPPVLLFAPGLEEVFGFLADQ